METASWSWERDEDLEAVLRRLDELQAYHEAALEEIARARFEVGVLSLRREGASKGATTAFMISTPQTGVDSILVSAAFLGWPFALFKLVAAFVTGLVGGALVNRLTEPDPSPDPGSAGGDEGPPARGVVEVVRYAVFDLLAAIDLWIVAGVVVAALITVLLPSDYFASQAWSQGVWGMLAMLAVALPHSSADRRHRYRGHVHPFSCFVRLRVPRLPRGPRAPRRRAAVR